MQRFRWFVYGIVVGTAGAAMGGGGAEALCRAMHDLGAGAVRTLESRPVETPPALPVNLAGASGVAGVRAPVPTVRADDLPPATKDPGADPHGPTSAP